MKRLATLVILLCATCAIGLAQTSMTQQLENAPARKSPLAGYAGSWIGMFEGHAWLSVHLNMQGGALMGTLQRPHDFQFNDNGSIKSVSQDRVTEGVENAVIQGDGLLITVKDPNTQQTSHYVMRLTSANTAEMKMVAMSMPPGMAKPQPWQLTRVMPNAIPRAH